MRARSLYIGILLAASIAVFRNQQRLLIEHQRCDARSAVQASKAVMMAQSKIDTLLGLVGASGAPNLEAHVDPTEHVADDANRKLLLALAAAT